MIILVYCSLDSTSIVTSLGAADYSYYFVMQRFLPLLAEFGEVVVLADPPDDDSVAPYCSRDRCVHLSFTPPDKTARLSRCPVIPVFAWEYSTIPDEAFRKPEDNWVDVLRRTSRALTHSTYAAEVVRSQLGEACAIESIPAPLWEACDRLRQVRERNPPRGLAGLNLNCTIIDSASYEISNTAVRPLTGAAAASVKPLAQPWDGSPLEYTFASTELTLSLVGFNTPEPWGVWARSGHPWIMLDRTISGEVELEISVVGYAHNVGQLLGIELGSGRGCLLLRDTIGTHTLRMTVDEPSNFLAFTGVEKRAIGMPDPRDLALGLAHLAIRRPASSGAPKEPLVLDFSRGDLVVDGCHEPESTGRWTAGSWCCITLPRSVTGNLDIRLDQFDLLHNEGRRIALHVGGKCATVKLRREAGSYRTRVTGAVAGDFLILDGLGAGVSRNPGDPRQLGLGIAQITISESPARKLPGFGGGPRGMARRRRAAQAAGGILYTTLVNPKDGRKNWEDIVTAFVYAFRDTPDATLLVKITNHDLAMFFEDIFTFFMELHPFACRVVFIHGYLDDAQYAELLLHTHYIVNASRGEGQCLPLMEFMSSGVPAIAPTNTAMAEYIRRDNAFLVASSPELTYWPHDPRQVFRTTWDRIDWQTLHDAFVDSAQLWRRSRRSYHRMARAAIAAQERFCSQRIARERLERLLGVSPEEH